MLLTYLSYHFLFKWNNSSKVYICLFIWGFIWNDICWIWCISRYLKNKLPTDEQERFHFFNSFFFRKLADLDKDPESASDGRAAFQRVRKWTRKVNLFEKDYILIPVNYRYTRVFFSTPTIFFFLIANIASVAS